MPSDDAFVRGILERVVKEEITISEGVSLLLNEMGRSSRTLLIDENDYALDMALTNLGYTTHPVPRGMQDPDIKRILWAKIVVTRNGKDFSNPKDMKKYHYGVLWVTTKSDTATLAQKIKAKLMQAEFKKNLHQVVKV